MTYYNVFGEQVEPINVRASGKPQHDISDIADRGREPDFTKESLIGVNLVVCGITGPEDFPLGAVYFVLLRRETDKPTDEPWGVMFPAGSPAAALVLRAARQNMLPFKGVLERVTSEAHPDQSYWNWRRK